VTDHLLRDYRLGEGEHQTEAVQLPTYEFAKEGFDYGLDGKWFEFNDATVSPVKITDIAYEYGGASSHCAYMLVYRRRDSTASCWSTALKPVVPESLVPAIAAHNQELLERRAQFEVQNSRITVKIVTLDQFQHHGNVLLTKSKVHRAQHQQHEQAQHGSAGAATAAIGDTYFDDSDAQALNALAELEGLMDGGQDLDEEEPFQGTVNDGIVNLRVDRDISLNIFLEVYCVQIASCCTTWHTFVTVRLLYN
jgi:hypothetical protein